MKTNKQAKKLSAIVSLLLAFVFMAITAVQAFHRHNYQSLNDNNDDDTEYVYASEKCAVCDYIVHKQSHHAHLAYPPVIGIPVTKAVTLLSKTFAGNYKFTLQGFTNKGPPAICC
ncbi:hypothetical protein LJ707_12825 [Mucilaginibacter sp. UR6-1]|uniref:hypothetical protein n=1 Tax=Mucilaginibacter sp. UR6-1 TaxID=1435643 RepID=UPI001E562FA4|nr:hypothetical protein [Mucilaginibacter sp. UR6-1]MCC8409813.1 hypothetical protein [Mucilaginibacter sp. UR6-1]